jgi:3-hydroxyisobutyrate dehydrogenase-like beta-hydroxyacid dehydrogenase
MDISVLGLGLMGRPIARGLIAAGHVVRGWNRSRLPDELTRDLSLVATIALAAQSQVCVLMLSDSNAVDAVLEQLEPHLTAGQLVIDMGTSDPRRSQAHAVRLAAKNIGWVDAPVSGGPEGAASRTLTIMAGGTDADFTRAKPLLEAIGKNVTHVGGPGAGHIVKIINQLIVGLTMEAVAEALTLAEKSGIDPRLVQQALAGGFADSRLLQLHGTRMIQRAYVPGGKAATQVKDLKLAASLADSVSLALPHLKSTLALYQELVSRGDGELDHSAVHTLLWQ